MEEFVGIMVQCVHLMMLHNVQILFNRKGALIIIASGMYQATIVHIQYVQI